jgi:hypothetical protein
MTSPSLILSAICRRLPQDPLNEFHALLLLLFADDSRLPQDDFIEFHALLFACNKLYSEPAAADVMSSSSSLESRFPQAPYSI